MTCGISATSEVEQDFGLAHRDKCGVIWKRDGHGLKIKEKQAEARRGLRGFVRELTVAGGTPDGEPCRGEWRVGR